MSGHGARLRRRRARDEEVSVSDRLEGLQKRARLARAGIGGGAQGDVEAKLRQAEQEFSQWLLGSLDTGSIWD